MIMHSGIQSGGNVIKGGDSMRLARMPQFLYVVIFYSFVVRFSGQAISRQSFRSSASTIPRIRKKGGLLSRSPVAGPARPP